MNSSYAKYLMLFGLVLFSLGVVFYLFGDKLNFIGNLPGDIKIEKDNFSLYIPITTMILLSVAFSIIVRVVQKLW